MPIVAADLVPHLSANHPDDDTSTAAGAIDTTGRPVFTQLTADSVIAAVSDGTDTRQLTVEGRLASGAIDTEMLTLNGTTEVVGAKTFERILKLTLSAADASRTVTVRQGAGGATRATIGPNETKRVAFFKRSASEAATAIRYELMYWRNAHASLTLNSAAVRLTADPDSRIRQGVAGAKGNLGTLTNRKTAPSGITFVDDNVSQSVPGGTLGAGETIGVYIEQTLPASDAPHRTTFTTELAGTTV